MSSSSDRFNYISQQLEQQNLSFKRIPGVDVKERQDLKNKYYSKVRNKLVITKLLLMEKLVVILLTAMHGKQS